MQFAHQVTNLHALVGLELAQVVCRHVIRCFCSSVILGLNWSGLFPGFHLVLVQSGLGPVSTRVIGWMEGQIQVFPLRRLPTTTTLQLTAEILSLTRLSRQNVGGQS